MSLHENVKRDLVKELNKAMPSAYHAALGQLLQDIITQHNALAVATGHSTISLAPLGDPSRLN